MCPDSDFFFGCAKDKNGNDVAVACLYGMLYDSMACTYGTSCQMISGEDGEEQPTCMYKITETLENNCSEHPDLFDYVCVEENGTSWLNACKYGQVYQEYVNNCSAYNMSCGNTVYDEEAYTECLCNQDSDCDGFTGVSAEYHEYAYCDPASKLCFWNCDEGYHIESNGNYEYCEKDTQLPDELANICDGKANYSACVTTSTNDVIAVTCYQGKIYEPITENCTNSGLKCGPFEYTDGTYSICAQCLADSECPSSSIENTHSVCYYGECKVFCIDGYEPNAQGNACVKTTQK